MRLVLVPFAFAFAAGAHASEWSLDDAHTNIGFSVKHMMVSDVHGGFTKYTGTINVDDKDVTKSAIQVDIDPASVDTHNEKRDGHLKSADFFDVAKFAKLTFKSTKVEQGEKPNKLKVTGDLTMHGVTKPVTLDVELSDEWTDPKDWGGNTHKGIHAVGTINRKDFGLNWQKQLDKGGVVAGDEVKLLIDAELVKKKAAA
jgi:polyisoprenoid-binding protein YceI